jgi:hypothetical protein
VRSGDEGAAGTSTTKVDASSGPPVTRVETETLTGADGRVWTRLVVPQEAAAPATAVSQDGLWILPLGDPPGSGRLQLLGSDGTLRSAPPLPGTPSQNTPGLAWLVGATSGTVGLLSGRDQASNLNLTGWLLDWDTGTWADIAPPRDGPSSCAPDQPDANPNWDGRVLRVLCSGSDSSRSPSLMVGFDLADRRWSVDELPPQLHIANGCRLNSWGASAETVAIPVTSVAGSSYLTDGQLELWIRRGASPWMQGPNVRLEGISVGRGGPNCVVAAGSAGDSVFVHVSTDGKLRRFNLAGQQVEVVEVPEPLAEGAGRLAPWRMIAWDDRLLVEDGFSLGILDPSGRIEPIPLSDIVGYQDVVQLVGIAGDRVWVALSDGSYLTTELSPPSS